MQFAEYNTTISVMNSQQLWSTAQELHKTKLAKLRFRWEGVLHATPFTEKLLVPDNY